MQHHAELYIGTDTSVINSQGDQVTAGPDYVQIQVDAFTIADARALTMSAHNAPVVGTEQLFVIVAGALLLEAQNALLKLLEEPPATSRFIFIVPTTEGVLPTLLSRVQVKNTAVYATNETFDSFLAAPYATRLDVIASKTKAKDTAWLEEMAAGVRHYASVVTNLQHKKTLVFIDTQLKRRGASKKMLLEELALTLPVGGVS